MAPMTSAPTSVLSARGERWVQRTRKPLDILALVFLGVFVLLWGFPDAPPALIRILNMVTWVVWAAFAVDYVVRLTCSKPKGAFVRTHKLDLVMVLVLVLLPALGGFLGAPAASAAPAAAPLFSATSLGLALLLAIVQLGIFVGVMLVGATLGMKPLERRATVLTDAEVSTITRDNFTDFIAAPVA